MRNRLKRLLREAFRRSQDRIPQDFDYVLMISPALSRKLKGARTPNAKAGATRRSGVGPLRAVTSPRMQESFLSLVEPATRKPSPDKDRTGYSDRVNHE